MRAGLKAHSHGGELVTNLSCDFLPMLRKCGACAGIGNGNELNTYAHACEENDSNHLKNMSFTRLQSAGDFYPIGSQQVDRVSGCPPLPWTSGSHRRRGHEKFRRVGAMQIRPATGIRRTSRKIPLRPPCAGQRRRFNASNFSSVQEGEANLIKSVHKRRLAGHCE